jgi:hypothetical protein
VEQPERRLAPFRIPRRFFPLHVLLSSNIAMSTYRHTQAAHWILPLVAGIGIGLALVGGLVHPAALIGAVVALPILIFLGSMFRSLTIEIADGELRWYFGARWLSRKVPLETIESAEAVRTNIVEGWGIHWSRFGWLYNVSGFDAVALRTKDGRRFCLGTDEPGDLVAILGGTG